MIQTYVPISDESKSGSKLSLSKPSLLKWIIFLAQIGYDRLKMSKNQNRAKKCRPVKVNAIETNSLIYQTLIFNKCPLC